MPEGLLRFSRPVGAWGFGIRELGVSSVVVPASAGRLATEHGYRQPAKAGTTNCARTGIIAFVALWMETVAGWR